MSVVSSGSENQMLIEHFHSSNYSNLVYHHLKDSVAVLPFVVHNFFFIDNIPIFVCRTSSTFCPFFKTNCVGYMNKQNKDYYYFMKMDTLH